MISLPIDEVLPALREALATRHEAVLEAPPGTGRRRFTVLRPISCFAERTEIITFLSKNS